MKLGNREEGFTLIEMVVAVIVLGVALSLAGLKIAGTRNGLNLRSGLDQVEAAMERCYSIADQEGVDVYLFFWTDSGPAGPPPIHPNRYGIYRVTYGYNAATGNMDLVLSDERAGDEPSERPLGAAYDTDGDHYWVKISEGDVSVQTPLALRFRREGSRVRVTFTDGTLPGPTGAMSVTLANSRGSGTVTITETGEIDNFKKANEGE